MDISGFFASINKVSLVAFVITLGALIYEINHLHNEKIITRDKPIIPSFEPNLGVAPAAVATSTPIVVKDNKKNRKLHLFIFVILSLMLLIFGFLMISSILTPTKKVVSQATPRVSVQEVQSSGIKIYDSSWQEIIGDTTDKVSPGSSIYIGIAMVKGSDIDKARIKVNAGEWLPTDITTDYNKEYNVYYIMYIIKENEPTLEIEAQLYSKSKGWLSE